MAQEFLDGPDIVIGFKEVGRAKGMNGDRLFDTHQPCRRLHRL